LLYRSVEKEQSIQSPCSRKEEGEKGEEEEDKEDSWKVVNDQ